MAKAVVLASGSGSNFQVLAEAIQPGRHQICRLICDRKKAAVFQRAKKLGITAAYVSYYQRERQTAEQEIAQIILDCGADIIFLAGFMRLLSPDFVDQFKGKIVNIHPALLPRHPGAHGIRDSYYSRDKELGVTIHFVDQGMDTGPIIAQTSFIRSGKESLEEIETRLHQLEHKLYPETALLLLEKADRKSGTNDQQSQEPVPGTMQ